MPLPAPGLQTRLLHADHQDARTRVNHPLAPDMSLSTTFRMPHPDDQAAHNEYLEPPANPEEHKVHVYSRFTQSTMSRAEQVLSSLLGAHALTYSSGLTACFAVLKNYEPAVIAVRGGYQGTHETFKLYMRGRDVRIIDLDDEYPKLEGKPCDETGNATGRLLVWLETPLNPTGEARDIAHYVARAHAVGGYVAVDSTFAPPPLQDPFKQGADMVLHSGTKYFGGHSDLLMGVVATKNMREFIHLWDDRSCLGARPGSFELYLLLRSLRTLGLRVSRQAETAAKLVAWLDSLSTKGTPAADTPAELAGGRVVHYVWHSSLQPRDAKDDPRGFAESPGFDPAQQMPGGGAPTFSVWLRTPAQARALPHELEYFTPATSLGGVESLIEQRKSSNKAEDPHVVRISTGVEDFEDLRADLLQAFSRVASLE